MSHGASHLAASAPSPVQVAKAALRRLALDKVEPTPENYARAYAAEGGLVQTALPEPARPLLQRMATVLGDQAGAQEELVRALMSGQWGAAEDVLDQADTKNKGQAQDWADLLQRLAQGLERGSRLWTGARKKDSLLRLLSGSRSDFRRLRERLRHLLAAWESESDEPLSDTLAAALDEAPQDAALPQVQVQVGADAAAPASAPAAGVAEWTPLVHSLERTVRAALPEGEARAEELQRALQQMAQRVAEAGAQPELVAQAEELCQRARRMLAHRQHLLDELGKLCVELTQGLTELAEDDSWARGQCEMLQLRLTEGLNVRSVRAASDLLANARKRQALLRGERNQARDALKELIQGMLGELGVFAEHTGRFHENVGRHAEAIASAESLDSLAGVVRQMLKDSSEVQVLVQQTQGRLRAEQERAGAMQLRVRELEGELRRLSDEVSTDALTQVANRRGLAQAFDVERARLQRARSDGREGGLAVGLIDIDNFKKLNDTLGHAAGDVALQKLAQQVREQLRPLDTVARFGGEEFVVLLPDIDTAEAQGVLTRLQRKLTASLFMHDNKEVFVTFSAGVTALREGEPLETALERADEALYEAKRTGKNRTCVA
ncbi:MAG: GGDEF domain-containing protein [Burkholderiales bacterium]|nr:GGDEF domain-containing protein [Burkholderiales bacterium]